MLGGQVTERVQSETGIPAAKAKGESGSHLRAGSCGQASRQASGQYQEGVAIGRDLLNKHGVQELTSSPGEMEGW